MKEATNEENCESEGIQDFDWEFNEKYKDQLNLIIGALLIVRFIMVLAYFKWPFVADFFIYVQGMLFFAYSFLPIEYGVVIYT